MNMQRMCRLCFLKLRNPLDIYTTPGLLGKILKVTDIRIQQGDGLPNCICDLCNVKVEVGYKFRHDVRRADVRIRSFMCLQSTSNATHQDVLNHFSQPFVYKWCDENVPDTLLTDGLDTLENFLPDTSRLSLEKAEVGNGRLQPTRLIHFTPPKSCKGPPNKVLKHGSAATSLIYSNANSRALVDSYKILIDYCLDQNVEEDFSLPSSYASSEDGSDSNLRTVTANNTNKNRNLKNGIDDETLKSITRTVINYDYKGAEVAEGTNQSCNRASVDKFSRAQTDPLNLLKIRIIQPLDHQQVEREPRKSYASDFYPLERTDWEEVPRKRPSTPMPGGSRRATGCQTPNPKERDDGEMSLDTSSDLSVLNMLHTTTSRKSPAKLTRKQESIFGTRSLVVPRRNAKSISGINAEQPLCPVCGRVCANVRGLKVHLRAHLAANCPICNFPTVTKDEFKDHMKLHIKIPEQPLMLNCRLCKAAFKNSLELSVHMRSHAKNMQKVYGCLHCSKIYATKRGLDRHVVNCHSGFITE